MRNDLTDYGLRITPVASSPNVGFELLLQADAMFQSNHHMKAVIIRNPISGSPQRQFAFARAVQAFEEAGWEVDVWVTKRKGHARALAAQAVEAGWPTIVVAGGDGSIGQTVDGMLHAGGHDVSLGIIPMGTGNVFAREMGLPFPKSPGDDAPARAARIIIQNEPVRIDVGKANGHHFLSWAGVGLDARVTEEVESQLAFKRRAPLFSYGATAVSTLLHYQAGRVRLVLDDEEVIQGRFPLVVAANIRLYARYFHLNPDARIDDGLMDLLIFTDPSKIKLALSAVRLIIQPKRRPAGVVRRQARRVELLADPPQPYHLDGDPLGVTPLTLESVHRGLRIHLPPAITSSSRFSS